MFNIQTCTLENRSFFRAFQEKFYQHQGAYQKIINHNIGKNFSYMVIQKNDKNHVVLFDVDDGSGITTNRPGYNDGDCKLIFSELDKIKEKFGIVEVLVFKLQLNRSDCEYYPFKQNVFPAGYYCDDQEILTPVDKKKDIDVFWMGTVNMDGDPWNWPVGKDIKLWPSGRRRAGFIKLKEIQATRKDLNIVCSSNKIPQEQYNDLIARSKICLELPGCGWFTKRMVENIRRAKCILSLEQKQSLHFDLIPNVHYCLIENNDFNDLEEKIDLLLNNSNLVENFESQSRVISKFFDYDYMMKYITETIDKST